MRCYTIVVNNEALKHEAFELPGLGVEAVAVVERLRENPNEFAPFVEYMKMRESGVTSPKEALLLVIEVGHIQELAGFYPFAEASYLDARVEARNLGEMEIHDAIAARLDNLPPNTNL